jgi:hypothetical protein
MVPRAGLDFLVWGEKSPESDRNRIPDRPTQIIVTIVTELSRLLSNEVKIKKRRTTISRGLDTAGKLFAQQELEE